MPQNSVSQWDDEGANLLFILSAERAGSTMLQLMLESHSSIYGVPEPNLMAPMKYLGWFGAPPLDALYDPVNQALGLKEFVGRMPQGEKDYIQACRLYANHLYRKVCEKQPGALYFLDKTPSNILVWDVLVRLFPKAKYIVLLRHPYALIDSFADSFYLGDYARMSGEHTRIKEHLEKISEFMSCSDVPRIVTRYEDIISRPQEETTRLLSFLGLHFEPAVVDYSRAEHEKGSMGDPLKIAEHTKAPVKNTAGRWVHHYQENPEKLRYANQILAPLSDKILEDCGYPRAELLVPLEKARAQGLPPKPGKRRFGSYYWQRKLYFFMHDQVRRHAFIKKTVEHIRYYCDLLLRP